MKKEYKKKQKYDCYTYSTESEIGEYGNRYALIESNISHKKMLDFIEMVYECSDCTEVKVVPHGQNV